MFRETSVINMKSIAIKVQGEEAGFLLEHLHAGFIQVARTFKRLIGSASMVSLTTGMVNTKSQIGTESQHLVTGAGKSGSMVVKK